MWPFVRRKRQVVAAADLFGRWFRPVVPEGHASLEAFEAAMTGEERERLPKTLAKLATDGVERIYQVRRYELEPDRNGLAYLDSLLDAEMRHKLTLEQDPNNPRNLFRVVCIEFGCIVGEILLTTGRAEWICRRAPNHWRSRLALPGGETIDPFMAVVSQLSAERREGALTQAFDRLSRP